MSAKQWDEIKNKIMYAIVIIVITNIASCGISVFGLPSQVNAMDRRVTAVEKGIQTIQSDIKLILKGM